MITRVAIGVGFVLVAFWAAGASAGPNDFEVMSTRNADKFAKGQKFERATRIEVPENGSVTLIDRTLPTVSMRDCFGKYEGSVERCPSTRPGTNRNRVVPGGVRGAQPD
jgi:hypothetical protein